MKQRSAYWQIIRAICIIAVIVIHCPNAIALNHSDVQFHIYMILRAFVNFPVAVFLFLSGYFFNKQKYLDNPRMYIFKRGVRLLIPYLIWSMVYISVSMVSHEGLSVSEVIFRLFTGKAAGPLYYIVVLLQLTLITPVLLRYKSRKINPLWLITPFALVVVYVVAIKLGIIPWPCDTLFPLWFGFYYLGLRLSEGDEELKKFLLRIGSLPIVMLAFCFNLLESYFLVGINVTTNLAVSQNRIGGFLYALTLVGLFYRRSLNTDNVNLKSVVTWIGDKSYAVYFTHYLVLKIVSRLIGNRLQNVWVLHFLAVFCGTLIATLAVISIFTRLMERMRMKKLLQYIGY